MEVMMKISTRVRYGVRLMIALAAQYGQGPVNLKDVARREEISEKYLGLIAIHLRSAGLIRSSRGAHGGYNLAREPAGITLREIINALEGETCLVDCVSNPAACRRFDVCASRELWSLLNGKIGDVLDSFTLSALVDLNREKIDRTVMQNI
jgi:Rrf2 family protein